MNEKDRKGIRENHQLFPDKELGPHIVLIEERAHEVLEVELDPKETYGDKRYEEVFINETEKKSFRYSEIVEALQNK